MANKFEPILDSLPFLWPDYNMCPDSVTTNNVKKYVPKIGGYKLQYNPVWGSDFYKFEFDKQVEWDGKTHKELFDTVLKYPQFALGNPKLQTTYVKLAMKENPRLTFDMLYNTNLIFDIEGYDRLDWYNQIVKQITAEPYERHSYYDNYINDYAETREDAESLFPIRMCATIDSNSIGVTQRFLEEGSDLLEKIGSKFFDAKIE